MPPMHTEMPMSDEDQRDDAPIESITEGAHHDAAGHKKDAPPWVLLLVPFLFLDIVLIVVAFLWF